MIYGLSSHNVFSVPLPKKAGFFGIKRKLTEIKAKLGQKCETEFENPLMFLTNIG